MTLSEERLRELAEFLRTPGSSASWGPKPYDECADAIDELISRRASPHGEAGVTEALDDLQQAEAEYREMHDRHGDGSQAAGRAWDLMRRAGDNARAVLNAQPVATTVTEEMVAALANSLFRDIGTVSDDAARRALEAALSASPGSSAGAEPYIVIDEEGNTLVPDDQAAAIKAAFDAVEPFAPFGKPLRKALKFALASAPPQREGLERLADTIETMEHDMEGDNEFEVGYRLGFTTAADAAAERIRKRIRALTGKGGE